MTGQLLLPISFFILISGPLATKQAFAVQEEDLGTGAKSRIVSRGFVEPVYLDDLDASENGTTGAAQPPANDHTTPSTPSSGPFAATHHSEPRSRTWRAYGSLGVSSINFTARAAVAFRFNRFLSLDPSLSYWSRRDGEYAGNGFGPEVAAVARLDNRTIFTPYAGAGVGYEKWQQSIGNDTLDDTDTGTAFYFFGLNVMMTKHFGLNIARRIKKYADDAPLDRHSRRPGDNPEIATEVGFQAVF